MLLAFFLLLYLRRSDIIFSKWGVYMEDENFIQFKKAKNLIKQKKYDEANKILKDLLRREPNDSMIKFEYAKNLLNISKGNVAEVKQLLIQLINTKSKSFAIQELGKIYANENDFDKAKYYFDKLLKHGNESGNEKDVLFSKLELGKLYANVKNFEKAKEYFEQLLDTSNENYALLELGRLYVSEGKNEQAKLLFEQLGNTHAMLELGRLYASEGKNEQAKLLFEQLLQIGDESDKEFATLELGRLYASDGENEMAENHFKSILQTDNKAFAMLELGRLYACCNASEKAKQVLEQLLKIGNENDKTCALIELLKLSIKNKKYSQALQYLDKLITVNTSLTSDQIKRYQLFLKFKLGKIKKSELFEDYFGRQMAKYNLKSALECISSNVDIDGKDMHQGRFNSNINIPDLFDICDETICEIEPYSYDVVDKYIVALDYNIGISMGMETNLVEVVTISNTKDIITMYPVLSKYKNVAFAKKNKTKKR